MPYFVWKCIDKGRTNELVNDLDKIILDKKKRREKVKSVSQYLGKSLTKSSEKLAWGFMYIFCNFLNLLNAALVFLSLDQLLQNNHVFLSYGYEVI